MNITRKKRQSTTNRKWKHDNGGLVEFGVGGDIGSIGGVLGMIPTPFTQIAGAAMGVVGGLIGGAEERKAAEQQTYANNVKMSQFKQSSISNPYAPTFASGGIVNGMPNVEVEGDEVMQGPDGSMAMMQGPSHAQGGMDVSAEPGTRVFSDKLKASTGKTFAQEADYIRKKMAKYESMLSK